VISVDNAFKSYENSTDVLKNLNLSIASGDSVALVGESGSGKSTLLYCLSLIDSFNSGSYNFLNQDVAKLSEADKSEFRLNNIGIVLQFHHLIPELSVLDNVLLPSHLTKSKNYQQQKQRAVSLLKDFGVAEHKSKFPWQLSGGEQQRVAIARALINKPQVLFTDEATGNLDQARSTDIVKLLLNLVASQGLTLISVTHDLKQASNYSKVLELKQGSLST